MLNALAKPIMLGIYQENELVKSYESDKKASEFLPKIIDELLKDYEFEKLIYANGPGSYMGIKVSFLVLKTLSIAKNIPMFAVSAFELNGFKPILANNNLCFVFENGKIVLKKAEPVLFFLPQNLLNLKLKNDILPFYFLDVV